MTLDQARKILRLSPDDDPRTHLAEFKEARDHIASMIRTAPDPTMSGRYMKGLIEFDEALTVVKKHLPPLSDGSHEDDDARPIEVGKKSEPVTPPPSKLPYAAWFAVIFVVAACGLWFVLGKNDQSAKQRLEQQIALLEREGSSLIENRRWQEAEGIYAQIEKLAPGTDRVRQGRLRIEMGMTEEQTQFIGYWTGQATAELEAGRLDEAESAARQVLAKYPTEKDAARILTEIAAARTTQSRTNVIAAARDALAQRKWKEAISHAEKILATVPRDPEATSIVNDAKAGIAKASADQAKADELLKLALARDQGQFDQQALDWLREAKSLAPDNAAIAAQLEKQASYTRTLRVPGDFATPAEALANARDRDRIVLAAGDWKGPLVVDVAVELQGEGQATTRVECSPEEGSAITLGPEAKNARISGISFRHTSFAIGTDRFSAALVRGGSVNFVDCKFSDASGHGLAVIEGGHLEVSRCRFSGNGWNGVAAIGQGSTLEVRESESLENYQHGIESWDGAAVILLKNRCEGNSKNGIHVDSGLASATVEDNQLTGNREFGLVIDSASAGKITRNTATGNLLGGMVVRSGAANVGVTSNQIHQNQGPGLVLEKGLQPAAYTGNTTARNTGQQILAAADLSGQAAATIPTEAPPSPGTRMPSVDPVPPKATPAPEPEPEPATIPRARIVEEPGR